uniref:Uncharacterized protein n=1 Tax=Lotharella oceanica TaxID=641309 RepID=A0A7S2TSS8_9EUKA
MSNDLRFCVSWENSTQVFGNLLDKKNELGHNIYEGSKREAKDIRTQRGVKRPNEKRPIGQRSCFSKESEQDGSERGISLKKSRERLANRLGATRYAGDENSPIDSQSSRDTDDSNESTGGSPSDDGDQDSNHRDGMREHKGSTSSEDDMSSNKGVERNKASSGDSAECVTSGVDRRLRQNRKRKLTEKEDMIDITDDPHPLRRSALAKTHTSTHTTPTTASRTSSGAPMSTATPTLHLSGESASPNAHNAAAAAAVAAAAASVDIKSSHSSSCPKKARLDREKNNVHAHQLLMKNILLLSKYGLSLENMNRDMCIVQNLMRVHIKSLVEDRDLRCLRCTKKIALVKVLANHNRYVCTCGETLWYSLCSNMLCSKDIGHRKHCFHCKKCQDDRCVHCDKCDQCYIPSSKFSGCPCHEKVCPVIQDEEACVLS